MLIRNSLDWFLASALRKHATFFFLAVCYMVILFGGLRVTLMLFNLDLAMHIASIDLLKSLLIGIRFDLIVTAYACLPLTLLPLFGHRQIYRKICHYWLTAFAGLCCFLAIMELYFYAEFQQRLNSLVFVYLGEDPMTVLSMLWYGFPVVTLLAVCLVLCVLSYLVFRQIEMATRSAGVAGKHSFMVAIVAVASLLVVDVALARGTLRSGPPLRWGDAYHSDNLFANQLALNGSYTLAKAWIRFSSQQQNNYWHTVTDSTRSRRLVREILLTEHDDLMDTETAVVRRKHHPQQAARDNGIENVVIILMESFSGEYVGALGHSEGVTPEFDKLATEGLLFTRFFSNGTHTHQGMFATLDCFPNLPGYEYLMQQPEGRNRFSGISRLLDMDYYQNLYVYNGDFSWDNQSGFFRNQGLDNQIGRDDIEEPTFIDPTWGVSDEDMFTQALRSLDTLSRERPFLAVLQTLSNHTPYSLPDPLPFEPVMEDGEISVRLTPMKYSDWALGQFFEKVRGTDYFDKTLFVILGDHGFGVETQISDVNLLRFHVPMLLLGPGIVETYGQTDDRVATQVDVVPTIMGLLGESFQHQCWGRNLLALPEGDKGFGIIKPSGGHDTVAIIEGDYLLTDHPQTGTNLFRYSLYPQAYSERLEDVEMQKNMKARLRAYVYNALQSLQDNTAGDR